MTDSTIGKVEIEALSEHLRILDATAAIAPLSRAEHHRVLEASKALGELIGSVGSIVTEYTRLVGDADGKGSGLSSPI